jgi:RHS repeat-associated protein
MAANGTLYWSMTPGVVAETDLAGTIKSEYIFFDGERVARRDGPTGAGGVFYYFSDHLKTASVITDAAGVIKAESDYYPWGGELQFVDNDTNDYKFTGKKRDLETRLDYFGARYYANELGRWVSADWSATPTPVPYASFGDPQTLNLYAYVGGNPASKADADGHICPSCVWAARAAEWLRGVNKDVKIGAAKGGGGFAVDMLKGSGSIITPGAPQLGASLTTHLTNLVMPKEIEKALQPSNKTQASAAKATKITLQRYRSQPERGV